MPSRVCRYCEADKLPFETTEELQALHLGSTVQKRALDAIQLGLGLRTRGHNIFVVGEPDSGKTSTVRLLLEKRAAREPASLDLCYLHDFKVKDRPRPVYVPAGTGTKLGSCLDSLVRGLQRSIPRILTSDAFGVQRRSVTEACQDRMEKLRNRLAQEAAEKSFELRPDGNSFFPVPLDEEGKAMSEEQFANLPTDERAQWENAALALRDQMTEYDLRLQRLERERDQAVLETEREAIKPVVADAVEECTRTVGELHPDLPGHLEQLAQHVVDNHRRFLPRPEEEDESLPGDPAPEDPFCEYRVNVLTSRDPGAGAPVVFERQPTLARVVGCLEYRESRGALRADHLSIRAGALHRAAGGYVVFQGSDLIKRAVAWEALKRAIRDREVRIEEPEDDGRPRTAGTVRPAPTPLGAKVIILGTAETYFTLLLGDEDFGRLFKVKAEFEPSIPWNKANVVRLARFLAEVVRQEGHRHLDRTAVARVVEYAAREAGDQRRLSTRVVSLLDVVAEADYRARRNRRPLVTGADVAAALVDRRRRHGVEEDDFLRTIREGTLLVSTTGMVEGQINGVAVYDTGDHAYGVPARITACTWVGKSGVVNIDREVELSGQIHDKGTLILIGLLGDRFAQESPLALSASITFEQSYDMVEGDSASCAEFLVLMSSLSGAPLRQGVAVTGSVDQQGEIQPVGGVNEKIEGMYRACRVHGLTGDQGVVIPHRNSRNLMLEEEVIEAIANGLFHVWTFEHIDQAIELLTGLPAGKRRADGSWEPDSVNDRVARRLKQMAQSMRQGKDSEPPAVCC